MAFLFPAVLARDATLIAEIGIAALRLTRGRTNLTGIECRCCVFRAAATHRVSPVWSVERGFATVAGVSAGLEFLFNAGDRVLQFLASLLLLPIAERCIRRKSALMRTPGGFIDSLAGRRIVRIRLGECIPDRAFNT